MKISNLRLVLGVMLAIGVHTALPAKTLLTWTAGLDALSMDPHSSTNSFTNAFVTNVYESLVRFNDKLQIEPALAESWKMRNPVVWRFHLRRGVKFHNGEAFDADDVVFTWSRASSPGSLVRINLSDIKEVRKVDQYTVDIETHAPFPTLLNELVQFLVMSKSWSEANNATEASDLTQKKENYANRHTNGTGPFIVKSREVDVRTEFFANPHWWDKKPRHNLTNVVFTPIKSDATRTSSLLSGVVDVSVSVPVQDVQRLQQGTAIDVVQGPELRTIFLGMDQFRDELLYGNVKGKNPFKDLRVRQALYQAIDVEVLKRAVMRGASWPAGSLISPFLNGAPASLNQRAFAYDTVAAKKLLADAGYPNGFSVGLQCPNNRYVYDEQLCLAITAMLARVGIKANPMIEPAAKWNQRLNTNDVSLYMMGHAGLPMADTYAILKDVVGTQTANIGGLNSGRYSNPRFDAYLPKIASELDLAKRNQLITEAVAIERNDVSHIPLHQQPVIWAAKKGIDLRQSPDNQLRLWLITVK
ncbi:ABC transporter substrate-binding protein [Verminephrobacter eiseniae]|uniref:ABC transporter substrate-binding protein n=1 Tax=Verminephrobacter eiseniae TaxID=364317 RepID=UPI0022375EB4|nr:ABC transporter substrate-binding protein [Verminephrobacter eiseniae]MCW5261424.1 ABC transporter substrate-binding protein [Verminephrobacter eiseniae]